MMERKVYRRQLRAALQRAVCETEACQQGNGLDDLARAIETMVACVQFAAMIGVSHAVSRADFVTASGEVFDLVERHRPEQDDGARLH